MPDQLYETGVVLVVALAEVVRVEQVNIPVVVPTTEGAMVFCDTDVVVE